MRKEELSTLTLMSDELLDAISLPLLLTNGDLSVRFANRAFQELTTGEQNVQELLNQFLDINNRRSILLAFEVSGISHAFNVDIENVWNVTTYLHDEELCFLFEVKKVLQVDRIKKLESDSVFYKTILDNLPSDIAVFDEKQRYLYLNAHAIRDKEVREWLIGKDDFDYVRRRGFPESIAELRRARYQHFLSNQMDQYSFEETMEKNGEKVTNLRIMKSVNHENGDFNFAVGYGLNINQLKDYESKIKNQEIAIEVSTDGIAILNESGEYTYLNDAHVRMYGFEKEDELLGKTWRELYTSLEIDRIEKEVFPQLMRDGTWSGETKGIRQGSNEEIHTEISLTMLPDRGLVCICRDVTERKMRDQTYRQLAVVASKTNSMVIITDADARVEWVNEAFLRRTGYTANEVIGYYPGELLDGPDTDVAVREQLKNATLNQLPFTGEKLSYMKDGTKVWFYLNATPIFNEKGELTNWVSVETDITLLKDAEDKVKHALDKERELSELKSRFVSMASHEFRTPLAGIMTSIELVRILMEKNPKDFDIRMEFHLERAMEEINRMTQIMDNILLFGKMQSGRIPFNPRLQDFNAFLQQLSSEIRLRFPERLIRVTIEGDVKEAAFDSKMMEHVFSNILHNALKYSAEDKPVEVVVKCDQESYEVSVRDRGIGIPEPEQDQLFTSFFRASNTGNIAGTGMGLVIVKQFVDLHKGKIKIKSKEKEGCVVSINFPLKPKLNEQGIDY